MRSAFVSPAFFAAFFFSSQVQAGSNDNTNNPKSYLPSTDCWNQMFYGYDASYSMSYIKNDKPQVRIKKKNASAILTPFKAQIDMSASDTFDPGYAGYKTITTASANKTMTGEGVSRTGNQSSTAPKFEPDIEGTMVPNGTVVTRKSMSPEDIDNSADEGLSLASTQAVGGFTPDDGVTVHVHRFRSITAYYLPQKRGLIKQGELRLKGKISCRKAIVNQYPPEGDYTTLGSGVTVDQYIKPGDQIVIPISCELGSPFVFEVSLDAKTDFGWLAHDLTTKVDWSNGVLGFNPLGHVLSGARSCLSPLPPNEPPPGPKYPTR